MKLVGRVAAAEKLSSALTPRAAPTTATTGRVAQVSIADQSQISSQARPSAAPSRAAAGAAKRDEHEGVEEAGADLSVWDPPPREELPHGKINDTRTFPQVSKLLAMPSLTIF